MIEAALKTKSWLPMYNHVVDYDHAVKFLGLLSLEGWHVPPLIGVDLGRALLILDGHHRAAVAHHLNKPMQAWTITLDQFIDLITGKFDGKTPNDLTLLTRMIKCGDAMGNEIAA